MTSTLNQWMVREYVELLRGQEGVVLLGLDALTVEEAQELRGRVRDAGANLRVTKNRLARVAMREVGVPIEEDAWQGMCAILAGDTEATIGAAKAIEEQWKKAEERKVRYQAALLDGSVMGPEEAARIPDMPDKNTLRGMMCGAIAGPARMLATLLQEVPASTARALQARADEGESA